MGDIFIVRKEGGSRVISITKVLPKEWKVIEIETTKKKEDYLTLKVKRVK